MKEIIHRGITSDSINENSYIAIKRALIDKNSIGVEFDIRLTKDKIIVLSHDSIIDNDNVENMNYSDIIKKKYLTTLDKILSVNSNKILLIDVKVNNNYKVFGDTLINLIKHYNRNIYISSFNKKFIKYISKKTIYKKGIISYGYRKNSYEFTSINYRSISNKRIKKVTSKEIFLWTIHDNNDLNNVKNKFANIDDYYIIIDKKI